MKNRRIILIRHGATKGNEGKRYVGRTDEPLLDISKEKLKAHADTGVKKVYISTLLRARETAEILFPEAELVEIDDLREIDFGDYEYKNHEELNGLKPYQRFIDSGGVIPFPNGEGREEFIARTLKGFERVLQEEDGNSGDIYIVAHGGTIMAIMDRFVKSARDFYDWMTLNGEGYVIRCEDEDHYTVCGLYP